MKNWNIRKRKGQETEAIFEQNMAETFSKMVKDINIQIQEAIKTPSRVKKSTGE